jgi:multidrug resistance efflux pump
VVLVAADEHALHVAESGRLVQWVESGASVASGNVLFRFENAALEDQLRKAEAEVAETRAISEAWEKRRGAESGSATGLAISRKRLQAAEKNLRQAARRVDRLKVIAHQNGQLSHRPGPPGPRIDQTFRKGQQLATGTQLGWIGHPTDRNAIAVASQDEVDLIQPGQSVRIRLSSLPGGRLVGEVSEVDRNPWKSVPPELSAGSDQTDSRETKYLVRIDLDKVRSITLPLRTVATAEIECQWRSIGSRFRRLVSAEFRGI